VEVLVGVAVGYEDGNHKINHLDMARDGYGSIADFVED
jgi:hypothetical protein